MDDASGYRALKSWSRQSVEDPALPDSTAGSREPWRKHQVSLRVGRHVIHSTLITTSVSVSVLHSRSLTTWRKVIVLDDDLVTVLRQWSWLCQGHRLNDRHKVTDWIFPDRTSSGLTIQSTPSQDSIHHGRYHFEEYPICISRSFRSGGPLWVYSIEVRQQDRKNIDSANHRLLPSTTQTAIYRWLHKLYQHAVCAHLSWAGVPE